MYKASIFPAFLNYILQIIIFWKFRLYEYIRMKILIC